MAIDRQASDGVHPMLESRILESFDRFLDLPASPSLKSLRQCLVGELFGDAADVAATFDPAFEVLSHGGERSVRIPGSAIAEGVRDRAAAGVLMWTDPQRHRISRLQGRPIRSALPRRHHRDRNAHPLPESRRQRQRVPAIVDRLHHVQRRWRRAKPPRSGRRNAGSAECVIDDRDRLLTQPFDTYTRGAPSAHPAYSYQL
jgi:hypothetical protein